NMYAYVRNDPVNGVDPSGLVTACVVDSTGSYCSSDSDDWVGFDGMSPGASGFSGMTVGWWDTSRAPKAKIPEPQNDVCDAPVVTVGLGGAVTGLVGSNFLQSENGFDLGVSIQIHIPTAFDLSNPFAGLQASFTLSDSKLSGSGAYVGAGANVVGGYGPAPASGFSTNSSRGFGGGLGRGPSASSVFSYSGGEGANTTGGTGAVGVRPGVGVGAYAAVYDTTNYNLATARLGC
ncbi:hypothetical protein, partial [Altererythrobacter sp.]|uniref:hypothetical protein n=1 Tax=Altererythrobacter sp. TaxID=1872480 RepID=UPI003D08AEA4